jgi:S1-C subfamily serine protease
MTDRSASDYDPYQPPAPQPDAWYQQPAATPDEPLPTDPRRGRLRRLMTRPRAVTGTLVAAGLVVGSASGAGITAAVLSGSRAAVVAGSGSIGTSNGSSGTGSGNGGSGSLGGNGSLPQGRYPSRGGYGYPGTFPGGSQTQPGTSSSVKASTAQSVGVVDIVTVDGYQGAEAAGTGLVLTSSGEILTNNHVIDGATKIQVRVVSTGKTYTAHVVGDAPTKDVAVLQLVGASGLATAHLDTTATVTKGESVVGVGNAGGVGGTPSAARGTVVATGRTITASSDDGSGAEKLTNMIVTNAPIQAGDSGGPLYDSANEVIGIDTAASSGTGATRGFAIPIARAVTVASEIEAGDASATIHLGYPAFLGVALAQSTGRPVVAHVYAGSPAAKAGLAAGDVITAIDGTAVATYAQLHAQVAAHSPGQSVQVTYTDASGASQAVTVTLIAGPAD